MPTTAHRSPLVSAALLGALLAASPVRGAEPRPPVTSAERWKGTVAEGVAEAKTLKSPELLVEIVGKSCGQCDRMDALILPAQAFQDAFGEKALVRIDWESADAKALATRFGLPGPPAWIWMTADGLAISIIAGPSNQGQWFSSIADSLALWTSYQELLAREQKDPSDRALVYEVAVETWKRGGESSSEPRFARLAADAKATPAIRCGSLAYLASIEMEAGRVDAAEGHLKQVLALSDDLALKEKAELRLADVEILRNNRPKALALLRKFKEDHPNSTNLPEVDYLIQALQKPGPSPAPAGK